MRDVLRCLPGWVWFTLGLCLSFVMFIPEASALTPRGLYATWADAWLAVEGCDDPGGFGCSNASRNSSGSYTSDCRNKYGDSAWGSLRVTSPSLGLHCVSAASPECQAGTYEDNGQCIVGDPPEPDPCDWDSEAFDYYACDWEAADVPNGDGDSLNEPFGFCDPTTDPYGCLGPPEGDACDPATDPFGCDVPPVQPPPPDDPEGAPTCPSGYKVGTIQGEQICTAIKGDPTCVYGEYLDPGTGQCGPEPWKQDSTTTKESTTTETTTETTNPDGSVTTTTETETVEEEVRESVGLPDLYEGEGRTYADAFSDFQSRVSAAPLVADVSNFYDVTISAGACPVYSGTVPIFGVITFDQWCDPAMDAIWPFIQAVLISVFAFYAFRIAFL